MAVGGIYLDKSRSFFLPVVIKMIFCADEACMPKKTRNSLQNVFKNSSFGFLCVQIAFHCHLA